MRYVVDRAVLEYVSLRLLCFTPFSIIPPMLHTRLHIKTALFRRTIGRAQGTFEQSSVLFLLFEFLSLLVTGAESLGSSTWILRQLGPEDVNSDSFETSGNLQPATQLYCSEYLNPERWQQGVNSLTLELDRGSVHRGKMDAGVCRRWTQGDDTLGWYRVRECATAEGDQLQYGKMCAELRKKRCVLVNLKSDSRYWTAWMLVDACHYLWDTCCLLLQEINLIWRQFIPLKVWNLVTDYFRVTIHSTTLWFFTVFKLAKQPTKHTYKQTNIQLSGYWTPFSESLEHIIFRQLVKKSATFYKTPRFIAALTTARHLCQSLFRQV